MGKVIFKPFLTAPVEINFSNKSPVANAGPDQIVMVNQTVNFDGSRSYDPYSDPLTYNWSFGDGTSNGWQDSSNASHSYKISGNYIVTLTVSDGSLTDTDTCIVNVSSIEINNTPPIANAGPDQNVKVNQTVNFDGSNSYDLENDQLTFNWSFGDGTYTGWQDFNKTSHSYNSPGNYTVTLTVSDGLLMDTDTCKITVSKKSSDGGITGKTEVSGMIWKDTTWTLANSPYFVTDNITVQENVTLTIEPGVIIEFSAPAISDYYYRKYLEIDGTLNAVGTESQMITFTSDKKVPKYGDWGGITFSQNSKDSVIDYCIIEYGIRSIDNYGGTIRISNNYIHHNSQPIEITENKGKTIITDNICENNSGTVISISKSDAEIFNNTLINNQNGIFCYENDIIIYNNLIQNGSNGVNCQSRSANISSNVIIDNNQDYGIIIKADSVILNNNNISNNGIGIRIEFIRTLLTNNNKIFQNTYLNVQNYQDKDVDLQYNWWGTTNTDLINQSIYDYYDDFEMGKVNYVPFLTAPSVLLNPPKDNNTNPPSKDNNTIPPSKISPKISKSNIYNNTQNIDINTSQIKITFSQPMNRSSVEAALSITPGVNYTLYWSANDTELLVVFTENLAYNTTYEVTIETSANDIFGNYLQEEYKLEFTTQVKQKGGDDGGDGKDKADEKKLFDISDLFGIIIILVLIVIIIALFAFIMNSRRKIKDKKKIEEHEPDGRQEFKPPGGTVTDEFNVDNGFEKYSYEVIKDLKKESLALKRPSHFDTTEYEMLEELEERYHDGEISKVTYKSMKDILSDQDM